MRRAALEAEGPTSLHAAKSQASERYAAALMAFGKFTDPKDISDPAINEEVLLPAIAAAESEVHQAALHTLRYRGLPSDHPKLDDIRTLVLSDPDPRVRREALEIYARDGDEETVLLFVQDLGRSSGPVRDIAVREWIRIETEREAHQSEKNSPPPEDELD